MVGGFAFVHNLSVFCHFCWFADPSRVANGVEMGWLERFNRSVWKPHECRCFRAIICFRTQMH